MLRRSRRALVASKLPPAPRPNLGPPLGLAECGLIARLIGALILCAASNLAQTTRYEWSGTSLGDEFGCAVAGVGDVDGDGFDDFAVGARREQLGDPSSGSLRVYSGANGALLLAIPGQFASFFGWSVAGAGDVDGDGHADIVVGAPSAIPNGPGSGLVDVYSGRDGHRLHRFRGVRAGEHCGWAVAGVGDVNADGYDDVAMSAPFGDDNGFDSGVVRVASGYDGSILYEFVGDSPDDLFGYSIAAAGDVDDDGYADLVVGALRDDDAGTDCGSIRVLSGRDGAVLFTAYGERAGARLGVSVGGGLDVDGDDRPDVVGGAHRDDRLGPAAGSATVFGGVDGHVIHRLGGDGDPDEFGSSVAIVGDVDGDGQAEVLVGAPRDQRAGTRLGSARLFSGALGLPIELFWGTSEGGNFGWSVAGAGDCDGDGFAEMLVGAITDAGRGRAFVLDLAAVGTPPRQRVHGRACPGAGERLPRIGWRASTRIGSTLELRLRGAALDASSAVLLVGDAITVPLDAIGSVGCTLYLEPFAPVQVPTYGPGLARFGLEFPGDAAMIGLPFECQWAVVDAGAPYPITLTFSDALSIVVGD